MSEKSAQVADSSLKRFWDRHYKLSSVLFLGALSSGIWNHLLEPIATWCGRTVLDLMSYVSSSYTDSLYEEVGAHGTDTLGMLPLALILALSLSFPWFGIAKVMRLRKRIAREVERSNARASATTLVELKKALQSLETREFDILKKTRRMEKIMWPIATVFTLLTIHLGIKTLYVREAAAFIESSIEILAPHLTEPQRLEFRADYRRISTAKQFADLFDRLRAVADENNDRLPPFNPVLHRGNKF